MPAAGHNDQTESFLLLKAKDRHSKICVFSVYSLNVVFFSPSKERPAHQAEPAALKGDKMAVVIQNFVQSFLTVSLLKQKYVSEKSNLSFILKSLDVTKTQ